MKKDTCVCHGDFNPTNIIIGEDDKLYVCDWLTPPRVNLRQTQP